MHARKSRKTGPSREGHVDDAAEVASGPVTLAGSDEPITGQTARATPRGSSPPADLATELLEAMARIRRANRRHGRRPVELSSLSSAQLEFVRFLRRHPGASVAEVAAELALAPNTVSTLVRQMVEAEIVTRDVDVRDRRVARLTLSGDIARKVDAWRDRRVVSVACAIDNLAAADVRRLSESAEVLSMLADQLEVQGEGR